MDLLRRINPKNVEKHLMSISRLQPSIAEDLLSSVDVPLSIVRDPSNNKPFLTCDYNRDLDSFRSPWSNKFYPELEDDEDSPYPSEDLRQLELQLNDSFEIYKSLYYEGGISSVFLWDQEDSIEDGFAGVVLIKKENDDGSCWDSIHVLEISAGKNDMANYQVTSTIILDLGIEKANDKLTLAGNLSRQTSRELSINSNDLITSHVVNIGSLVEDIESKLRNLLQEVYFGKTRDIIGDLRSLDSLSEIASAQDRQSSIVKGLQGL